jgi:tetratricopeptide (TPR) repeat protein
MFAYCAFFGCVREPQTLSAAVMVKNEADAMRLTLASLSNAGIRDLTVYDTGSSDDTIAVVRQGAAALGVSLTLFEGEFVDFATSRNVLLERARFSGEWLLLLDAGDVIRSDGAENITAVLAADTQHCAMYVEQQWNTSPRHFVNRLIRNDGAWRYRQPVHEYLEHNTSCAVGTSTLRLWQNRSISGRTSRARWHSDIALLQRDSATNARSAYYLANTYNQLGMWPEAIDAYKHRIAMTSGWYEEVEASYISLVQAYLELGDTEQADRYARELYTKHKRIEALMALARHAIDVLADAALCVDYATLACTVPPVERHLFMDPQEYTVFRYSLREFCLTKLEN